MRNHSNKPWEVLHPEYESLSQLAPEHEARRADIERGWTAEQKIDRNCFPIEATSGVVEVAIPKPPCRSCIENEPNYSLVDTIERNMERHYGAN
jgi:hypothetical protein